MAEKSALELLLPKTAQTERLQPLWLPPRESLKR